MSRAIDKSEWSRAKSQYASSVLAESASLIRSRQQEVVSEYDLFETGTLESSLKGHFTTDIEDTTARLTMRYLLYARFLDMPDARRQDRQAKREGYHLYNRTIYGILYNRTLPAIAYGFSEELRNEVTQLLQDSYEGDADLSVIFTKALRKGIFNPNV